MTVENTPHTTMSAISSPVPYGGFWRRFWAFWLDSVVIALIPAICCLGAGFWLIWKHIGTAPNTQDETWVMLWAGLFYLLWCLIGFVCSWLYFALLESGKHQATWGKRLLGLKVVGAQGQRISFARASGRFFAKMVSYAIFYIGFIMMPFTNRKRALHDMLADTYVVKESFQPGQPLPPTPSHIGLLVAVIILLFGVYAGLIGVSFLTAAHQNQSNARLAAAQMQLIRQDKENWQEIPGVEQMSFFVDTENNIYASFSSNGTDYLFALTADADTVCCLNNTRQCQAVDVPPCL